jgi:phage-related protein
LPEVSKAFGMAGDVITRNLFWPLRKEIVPLLQKMLDWVRDHRAMFVQWGNVLVNIFRTIKTIVMGFIEILQHMWERLSAGLERIFGKTTNTVSQTINLILFKITAVFIFVKSLMEPFIDFMVDGFLKIIEYVKAFATGFMEGLANIGSTLGEAMKSFRGLYDVIHNLLGDGNALVNVFKLLGNVIGGTVRWAIIGLSTMIDGLAERIERFTNLINMLKIYKETGNLDFATKMGEIGDKTITAKYAVRDKQRAKTMMEGDAQTFEAMKKNFSPASNTNNSSSKVDNSTTNIHVSGSKDPAKDATDIHKNLKKAKTLQGH